MTIVVVRSGTLRSLRECIGWVHGYDALAPAGQALSPTSSRAPRLRLDPARPIRAGARALSPPPVLPHGMDQPPELAEIRRSEPVDRKAHDTLRLFARRARTPTRRARTPTRPARPSGPDREAEKPVRLLSRWATTAGVHPAILGGGLADRATVVLGGGGMAEQDSEVLGGGGMAEQDSEVLGGGGIAEQDREVLGGGGMAEQEGSAVLGGGGMAEQEESVVRGDGGMAEPDSAVVGGGGMAGLSQATSAGSSSSTVQSQLTGSGPSSIPLMVRLISVFDKCRARYTWAMCPESVPWSRYGSGKTAGGGGRGWLISQNWMPFSTGPRAWLPGRGGSASCQAA
jgi:hypothetical protein